MIAVVVITYVAASLTLGGLAATYEIWAGCDMSALRFGLFVAAFWPILLYCVVHDYVRARLG